MILVKPDESPKPMLAVDYRCRSVDGEPPKVITLVICGELDQATPPELNRLIAAKVPGAHYVELARCGHCPPLEAPDAFLGAIEEFLEL